MLRDQHHCEIIPKFFFRWMQCRGFGYSSVVDSLQYWQRNWFLKRMGKATRRRWLPRNVLACRCRMLRLRASTGDQHNGHFAPEAATPWAMSMNGLSTMRPEPAMAHCGSCFITDPNSSTTATETTRYLRQRKSAANRKCRTVEMEWV